MKNKINIRLLMIAIIAIVATAIGITITHYGLFRRQVRSDLQVHAKLLKETHYFESANIDKDTIDLSSDIKELRVTWIAADGTVLYDNDNDADTLNNHSDRPEISDAFEYGVGTSERRSDTMNKNTFYYAVLLDNNTVLRISTEAENLFSAFMTATPIILIIVLVIIVICIILSHMLTKQLITPIETMAKNIEDVSKEPPYKELTPFVDMIRRQHTDVLSAAKARQDFSANVSHELKTPLTAISGYAELIDNGIADEEQQKHFVKEIRKNSDRLLSLINDIIKLSELDRSGHQFAFEEIDLYECVADGIETLRVNASKRHIKIHFDGTHTMIRANREMVRELVDNLVQNSIRYNNEDGNVWVEVIASPTPVLVVKDDGIGIPKEDQSRVFERFYRVDKSRSKATGGTGLGLAIVKHILELHDASIELESEVNKGTTIRVKF